MSCQHADGLVNAYVDGELDFVRTLEFEDHLKGCAECRTAIHEYDALRQSIKTDGVYFEAPESLEHRIRKQLRTTGARESKNRYSKFLMPGGLWWPPPPSRRLLL